ncbi:MAG: tRNA-uridine aminocarboxypropyltransferase [Pirellulales bacterium]
MAGERGARAGESASWRERCYGCYRPVADCVCGQLPRIATRTHLLIVQHRRERFHAFNTARLVRQAFLNSTFHAGHKSELAERLAFQPGAALLFPGDEAPLLDDLPLERRPRQLVIVDGTWHQAKTLVRDLPALAAIPRVRLAPATPSRYRIRREPNAEALSTLEAVVEALQTLEPQTAGLDQLVDVFRRLVDRQAEHPKAATTLRTLAVPGRQATNIPRALVERWSNVVIAYGETEEGGMRDAAPSREETPRRPLVWIAERLATGERFAACLRSERPLSDRYLQHVELPASVFAQGESLDSVRGRWREFLRASDFLVVYHAGAQRLVRQLTPDRDAALVLRSIDIPALRGNRELEPLTAALQLRLLPAWHPGRAGRRLEQTRALAGYLRATAAGAAQL